MTKELLLIDFFFKESGSESDKSNGSQQKAYILDSLATSQKRPSRKK